MTLGAVAGAGENGAVGAYDDGADRNFAAAAAAAGFVQGLLHRVGGHAGNYSRLLAARGDCIAGHARLAGVAQG